MASVTTVAAGAACDVSVSVAVERSGGASLEGSLDTGLCGKNWRRLPMREVKKPSAFSFAMSHVDIVILLTASGCKALSILLVPLPQGYLEALLSTWLDRIQAQ